MILPKNETSDTKKRGKNETRFTIIDGSGYSVKNQQHSVDIVARENCDLKHRFGDRDVIAWRPCTSSHKARGN